MNSNKEMIRNLVDMANGLIGDAVYFVGHSPKGYYIGKYRHENYRIYYKGIAGIAQSDRILYRRKRV